jgi:hypothetical protein
MGDHDFVILLRATAKSYYRSFLLACRVTFTSWKNILIQILGLLILGVVSRVLLVVFSGGGLLVSLMLGLLLAFFLSFYLCMVRYGLESEKISFESLKNDTGALFSPVISALFTFFVIRFTIDFLRVDFLNAAVGILLAVFLNPLPEVLYTRGGSVAESFTESFEFVKENFIEWFMLPLGIVLLVYGPSPKDFFEILSVNPLYQVEMILFRLSSFALSPVEYALLFLILIILYFIMVFRGALFNELRLGRRARIYREKQMD